MMTERELTLSEALSFARVAELPEPLADSSIEWVRALVLVRKYNGRENYAVAVNQGGGSMSIIKDFGSMCGIKEIVAVYPYEVMTEKARPILRNREEIVAYLVGRGENEEVVRQLLSDKTKSGKEKADSTKTNDRAKVKAMVNKAALAEQAAVRGANDAAYAVAHYEDMLPELPNEGFES